MANLKVSNFSCIEIAEFEPSDVTVIIGPQGSGKSVLCKLSYYFNYCIRQLPLWLSQGEYKTTEDVFDVLERRFSEWFPPDAWGKKPFNIYYKSGSLQIEVKRQKTRGGYKAKFTRLDGLTSLIESGLRFAELAKSKPKKSEEATYADTYNIQMYVQNAIIKSLQPESRFEFYIPAGRSFFTSVGKIVTALDGGTLLDPVVSLFGQTITRLRERNHIHFEAAENPSLRPLLDLLGGKIVHASDGKQHVMSVDGRKIPISSLSSGQQELLPLYYALGMVTSSPSRLAYIEEPEAHLFPNAQTQLVELLVQLVNTARKKPSSTSTPVRRRSFGMSQLVLTTHSPYVLSKLNNLIKAGEVASKISPSKRKELEKIVSQNSWLRSGQLSAYAIHERELIPIIDPESGMIDAGYIDYVSEDNGLEFERILDLED
jgi:hypothetical protein